MSSERLGAITDGIVAIAATIMVLELKIPTTLGFDELISQLPVFLAHFNSFFMIYVLWYNHYIELKKCSFLSVKIVLLNGLWLATISLLPFSTGWVSSMPNQTAAQLFYLINLSCCFFIYHWILNVLVKEKVDHQVDEVNLFKTSIPVHILLFIGYVLAFFYPTAVIVLVFIVVLYNIHLLIKFFGRQKSH